MRLPTGDDDFGFAVAVEITRLDVLHGNLRATELIRFPFRIRLVLRHKQLHPRHRPRPHPAPATHNLIAARAQKIRARQRMTILEGCVQLHPLVACAGLHVHRHRRPMLRLNGGDKARS